MGGNPLDLIRRVRVVGTGFAAALACVSAVAAGAMADGPAPRATFDTSVSISSRIPAFSGRIESELEACERGRGVVLVEKSSGSKPKRIGRDESSGSGKWAIPVDDLESGAYYARVKRTRTPGDEDSGRCRPARSEVLVID